MAKYVDLTFTLYDGFPNYPILPRMEFKQVLEIGVNQSPSNVRLISMPTHGGTHFDAPAHQVKGARTVDNVSIERCVGPAVMLDLSYKYGSDDLLISKAELFKFDNMIKKGDIVVLNTGCYAHPEEFSRFGHLSLEAAQYLVDKKITLLAVDTPSVDINVPHGEPMPVHQVILGNDIPIIEGLAHLDLIVAQRFTFIGLPLKIKGADGGPIRAIAIIGE